MDTVVYVFSCINVIHLELSFNSSEESQTLLAKLYQALPFIGLGFSIAELLRSFTVAAISRQLTALQREPQDISHSLLLTVVPFGC